MPDIRDEDPNTWMGYMLMALIPGLVNTVIHPLLKLLSCPLITLTLGVFVLVINGAYFFLAARIT